MRYQGAFELYKYCTKILKQSALQSPNPSFTNKLIDIQASKIPPLTY